MTEIAREVVKWWEEHKYDSYNDGEEDYNTYGEPPKFVILAYKELRLKMGE